MQVDLYQAQRPFPRIEFDSPVQDRQRIGNLTLLAPQTGQNRSRAHVAGILGKGGFAGMFGKR